MHGNAYEVDDALVGRTIELLFDPFNLDLIEVRWQGRSFGQATAHEITRHVHPRAQPETDAQPPPATGIDYLRLLAADHEQTLKNRIAYRDITADIDDRSQTKDMPTSA